jgi:signal transduction histidine kinase
MTNHFPFRIIDGFLATNNKAPHNEASLSSGFPVNKTQLLQHLVGDAAETNLLLVLEAFQKRLDGLLDDRIRVGRNLHDRVLGPLFTITLSLKAHHETCTSAFEDAQCFCKQSIEQLNKAIQDIRKIIRTLEEGEIQEFDLMSEMYSMINTYERLGLQIELIIESQALNLLTQQEKCELFTIAREALSNSLRHARATRATVKLRHSKARMCLAVLDNGIGFNSSQDQPRGYGLSNMESRARKLGGRLHIRSQRGRGTTIIAEFALEPILTPL